MVLAASRRIAAGQVPHGGFVTPRPAGSPVLHLIDLVLPGPLLVMSRAVALLELLVATVLLARIGPGAGGRWTPVLGVGVALALVLNLHTFPLMAWHTIDGILLSAVALWAWERWTVTSSSPHLVAALGAAGAAVVVKQSFAPLAVVLVIAAWRRRCPPWAVGLALAPGLAYVAWVAATGGMDDAWAQLGAADRPDLLGSLIDDLRAPEVLLGLIAGAAVAWARRRPAALRLPAAALATVVAVGVPLSAGLERGGTWGVALFWMAVPVLAAEALRPPGGGRTGPPDGVVAGGLGLLLVGWEVCLSWGYPVPNLIAGSLTLAVLRLAWAGVRPPALLRLRSPALAVLAVGGIALIAGVGTMVRRGDVYRSRPASELTVDLGDVAAEGRGIAVDPATAGYVGAVARCRDVFAAEQVAVLPDNPGMAVLLDLDSPLSTDWVYPPEIAGAEERVHAELRAAADDRDTLVLFQVRSAEELSGTELVPAGTDDEVFWYDHVGPDLGVGVPCGPFLAFGGAVASHQVSPWPPPR